MDSVWAVCALALTAALAVLLLRPNAPLMAALLSLAAGVWIVLRVFPEFSAILTRLNTNSLAGDWLKACLRITLIGLLGQWTASFCRDAGENGLAEKLEFAVKVTVIGLCLPYLEQILSLAEKVV